MTLSKFAKVAKEYYDKGEWSKERVESLARAGRISWAEYDEIVGKN